MGIEAGWIIAVKSVAEFGTAGSLQTTDEQRADLANKLGILECQSLDVSYKVSPTGKGRYRVIGSINAKVVQACIVTLEPVPADLTEPLDVEFWPADQIEVPDAAGSASDTDDPTTWLDPNEADPPEPIEQGHIPIGRLVFEHIAAALDPYPRKSGAAFDWRDPRDKQGDLHPFASLKQLKPKS